MIQQADDGAFQIHPAGRFMATLHLSAENIFAFFVCFLIVGRGRGLAKTTSVESFFSGVIVSGHWRLSQAADSILD